MRCSVRVKRGGEAQFTGASGASDAVDEVLRDLGQVVVDDVGDVLHVNAAGGQVGRDQNAVASLLESGQGGGALRLRAVAVNHGGGKAFTIQVLGQALGAALGAGEDQAASGFLGEQAVEYFLLAVGGDFESLHADVFRRLRE